VKSHAIRPALPIVPAPHGIVPSSLLSEPYADLLRVRIVPANLVVGAFPSTARSLKEERSSGPDSEALIDYESKCVKRLLRDSASVGWAKMASRNFT
jgi:hypothetical protein